MGFSERSNRKYTDVWGVNNETNKGDGGQAADLCIETPKKIVDREEEGGKRDQLKGDKGKEHIGEKRKENKWENRETR